MKAKATPTNSLFSFPLSRREVLAGMAGSAIWATGLPAAPADSSNQQKAMPKMDAALLERAITKAREFEQLHSLIIARDGEVQFAEALRGPPLNRVVNVKSVSKTIVAALTGIALDRGILKSVEQPVTPFLQNSIPADADPRLRQITIDHLLSMRAGLERTSGPNYGRWVSSPNWVRFALSRPFVAEPGERMLYSTGSYHLLAAVLTKASGRSLLELARTWLGKPLGIDIPPWMRDPQGIYMGGNNMALSPNSLLKFGELYRLQGIWNDKQVISENWIETSWTPRTRSPFSGDTYGYGWFIDTVRGHPVRYARGYGGQLIYLIPDLGVTVVITSDPTQPARSEGYFGALKSWLADDVMAAAERV
jgi:CubicO group peptidase (beta-lactamase class C family)